jgi:hypothetical protein
MPKKPTRMESMVLGASGSFDGTGEGLGTVETGDGTGLGDGAVGVGEGLGTWVTGEGVGEGDGTGVGDGEGTPLPAGPMDGEAWMGAGCIGPSGVVWHAQVGSWAIAAAGVLNLMEPSLETTLEAAT